MSTLQKPVNPRGQVAILKLDTSAVGDFRDKFEGLAVVENIGAVGQGKTIRLRVLNPDTLEEIDRVEVR